MGSFSKGNENLPSETQRVFLSVTVKDADTYRQEARIAINGTKGFKNSLQEDWHTSAANVVDLCHHVLTQESDAYIGVFGFRYGWIPHGYNKSITHMECDWAFEHRIWKNMVLPPIFIFVPEPASDAYNELLREANATLSREFSDDQVKIYESKEKQNEFRRELCDGRFYQAFFDRRDLCKKIQISLLLWKCEIITGANQGRKAASYEIPLDQLGGIDRFPQVSGLVSALRALYKAPAARGMCVLVHGKETMGHHAFQRFLHQWEGWESDGGIHEIKCLQESFDPNALAGAALEALVPDRTSDDEPFKALAEAIARRSEDERQVLILPRVEQLAGGLDTFFSDFWNPLYAELQKVEPLEGGRRLVVVAFHPQPLPCPQPGFIHVGDVASGIDFGNIVALPELSLLTEVDVFNWLNNVDREKKIKPVRRAEIAEKATKSNPVPLLVFERLHEIGFWKDIV